jgi:hypothetical protein
MLNPAKYGSLGSEKPNFPERLHSVVGIAYTVIVLPVVNQLTELCLSVL